MAREQFAERGYGDTSIRGVAGIAGVDPSLVTHYYGSKVGLFSASLGTLSSVPLGFAQALQGDRVGLARRIAKAYFMAWEDPDTGRSMRAMVRAANESPKASESIKTFLEGIAKNVDPSLVAEVDPVAVQGVLSQLLGIALARYIFEIRPFSDLSVSELIDFITPAVDATLSALPPQNLGNKKEPRSKKVQ